MAKRGVVDPDMNKYDLEHATAAHPKMTREDWDNAYHAAWAAYYTPEHKMTILRRAAACGMGTSRLLAVLSAFSASFQIEKLHLLQAGAFRLKYRLDRRPGFPIEPVELDLMCRRAVREQKIKPYADLALTPVTEEETETLQMFTHNEAARHEVAHVRKVDELTRTASTSGPMRNTRNGGREPAFGGKAGIDRSLPADLDLLVRVLALQLRFLLTSESMGHHDSEDHGWREHRSRRRLSFGHRRYGM